MFIHCRNVLENGGVIVTRSKDLELAGSTSNVCHMTVIMYMYYLSYAMFSLSRLRLLLVSRVLVSPAPVLTGVGVVVGGAAGVAVEGLTVVIHLSLERQ